MTLAQIRIQERVLEAFPATRVAVLVAGGVDNTGSARAVAAAREGARSALERVLDGRPLAEHPHVQAWRRTYRALGLDPTKKRPSAEALARRLLRTGELPRVSDVVDLYNVASVTTLLPAGGYDRAALSGTLELRHSAGGEDFVPLGQVQPAEPTAPGEVVYADEESVVTRAWNHRDGERTRVRADSRTVVLLCEAADESIASEALQRCIDAMETFLHDACGASTGRAWLDATNPGAAIPAPG